MINELKARAFDLLRQQQVIGIELQRVTREIHELEEKQRPVSEIGTPAVPVPGGADGDSN